MSHVAHLYRISPAWAWVERHDECNPPHHHRALFDSTAGHRYRLPGMPRAKDVTGGRRHQREASPLVALTTRIPRQLWQRVRVLCVEQDRELQAFVAEALREYLRQRRRL